VFPKCSFSCCYVNLSNFIMPRSSSRARKPSAKAVEAQGRQARRPRSVAALSAPPQPVSVSGTTSTSQVPAVAVPAAAAPATPTTEMISALGDVLQPLIRRVEALESAPVANDIGALQPSSLLPSSAPLDTLPIADLPASAPFQGIAPPPDRNPRPFSAWLHHSLSVPISTRLRDRIVKNEFVEFDELLPDQLQSEEDVVQLSVGTGQSVQLVKRPQHAQPQRRVHDIASWLEAFTLFMRVIADSAPAKLPSLLTYQSTILEANNNYHTEAWLTYDRRFRRALATLPMQYDWAKIDPNLWQSCFTSHGRPPCPRCNTVHPIPVPRCPFRGGPPLAPTPSGGYGAGFSSATPPAPLHQGKPICRNYNRGACSNTACPRSHVCLRCRGRHSEHTCSRAPGTSGSSST